MVVRLRQAAPVAPEHLLRPLHQLCLRDAADEDSKNRGEGTLVKVRGFVNG